MALLSLIYGDPQRTKISQIEVDVTTEESHETTVQVTDNPVESGSNVTDNAFLEPAKLSISGIITDSPIFSIVTALTNPAEAFQDNRARRIYDQMLEIQAAREPITIITGLKQYENMILTTLTTNRDTTTGKSIRFSASFTQIRTVDSQTININTDTDPEFHDEQNLGKQNPVQTSEATQTNVNNTSPIGSLLSNLTGLGG